MLCRLHGVLCRWYVSDRTYDPDARGTTLTISPVLLLCRRGVL